MNDPEWNRIQFLVTHGGTAHVDDLVSCCLLMALAGRELAVERRNPTAEDLEDPGVAVLDIGRQHDPAKMNFDHHQPGFGQACAVTLILRAAGLENIARQAFPWLKGVEIMDCSGPAELAVAAEMPLGAMGLLDSPFRQPLLTLFESGRLPLQIMLCLGQSWLESLRTYETDMEANLAAPVLEHGGIRVVQLAGAPNSAFQNYLVRMGEQGRAPHAMIYPNERGPGTVMARAQPCPRDIDFRSLAGQPGVEFVHANGFLAVTKESRAVALRLIGMAATPPGKGQ